MDRIPIPVSGARFIKSFGFITGPSLSLWLFTGGEKVAFYHLSPISPTPLVAKNNQMAPESTAADFKVHKLSDVFQQRVGKQQGRSGSCVQNARAVS